MKSVLFAEAAVLVHFKSVRIVFLVLLCVVISLFALSASHSNLNSHTLAPPDRIFKIIVPGGAMSGIISLHGEINTTKKDLSAEVKSL